MLNTYILIDRSGSMATRWDETLGSINAYVDELSKQKTKSLITVATFDRTSDLMFDVIRDAVKVKNWTDITSDDATPRGMTPLFDAIGHVVTLSEKANKKKTVIVVVTDGHENASREFSKEAAKSALDRCEAKNWQTVFLGADFNAFGEAAQVGVTINKTINMTAGNYDSSLRNLASKHTSFVASGQDVSFTDDDRKDASK